MNSSDCVANENEWSDSEGKRVRSSPKARVGDPGVGGMPRHGLGADVQRGAALGGQLAGRLLANAAEARGA
jgi:hypothetical protein